MSKIKALIVEDENAALMTLTGMLHDFCPEVEVIATAASVVEAIKAAELTKPNLVFLDIEMPPMGNGFDFVKVCKYKNFKIIFTTAYPQHAIQAINEIQPIAYLVKPFSVSSLVNAVQSATKSILPDAVNDLTNKQREGKGLIIHDLRKGNTVLRYNEILYLEGDTSVTHIFYMRANSTTTERITATGNIGSFEASLPKHSFMRTHSGYIVNIEYIIRYEQISRTGLVHLSEGSSIPVAVQRLDAFKYFFEGHIKGTK